MAFSVQNLMQDVAPAPTQVLTQILSTTPLETIDGVDPRDPGLYLPLEGQSKPNEEFWLSEISWMT